MVTGQRGVRYWTKVLYALVCASIAGCAGGSGPGAPPLPALMVQESQAGSAIEVERGRKVTLRLPANRSAGYRWFLVSSGGGALEPVGEPFYAAEASMAGAGSFEYWSFMPVKSGTQELKFEHRRPWEKDKPAARELSYRITVR